jgi:dihydrofolate reductase
MISLIVALSDNRVIGVKGQLPWHLPNDLKFFKQTTLGKPVIMGRKTLESIGRPLPGRTNIVLSRDPGYHREGVTVVRSLDEALSLEPQAAEHIVAGGGDIFRQALPRADRLYLTVVHTRLDGDTYFPEFDREQWRTIDERAMPADERHAFPYTFSTLERVSQLSQSRT